MEHERESQGRDAQEEPPRGGAERSGGADPGTNEVSPGDRRESGGQAGLRGQPASQGAQSGLTGDPSAEDGGGAYSAPGAGPGGQNPGGAAPSGAGAKQGADSPLLPDADARDFEHRWQELQVGFVNEPQRCVQEADGLVGEVMQRIADEFARERRELEEQWAGDGEASTENLRVALQRYRSFFNRLLRTS